MVAFFRIRSFFRIRFGAASTFLRVARALPITGFLSSVCSGTAFQFFMLPHIAPATCGGHQVGRRARQYFLAWAQFGVPIRLSSVVSFDLIFVSFLCLSHLNFSTAQGTSFMWGLEAFRCNFHLLSLLCLPLTHLCLAGCSLRAVVLQRRAIVVTPSTIVSTSRTCLHLHAPLSTSSTGQPQARVNLRMPLSTSSIEAPSCGG